MVNKSFVRAAACTLLLHFCLQFSLAADKEAIWSIGKPDGLGIEFAPGARMQALYTVGKSVPSRDFPGTHDGNIRFNPAENGDRVHTIVFDLKEAPRGRYELVLDLIFQIGAPKQIKIKVNDKTGIFPIRPMAKKSSDGEEASAMLLGKQSLTIPINGSWLKEKDNRISIIPLGIGSIVYDALTFRQSESPRTESAPRLEPTLFFHKSGGDLTEVCEVIFPFEQRFGEAIATVQVGNSKVSRTWTNNFYDFGLWTGPIDIPARHQTGSVTVEVKMGDHALKNSHDFVAAKQWKVFVCPKVHNDVGYTDLQPHVNELDNRNTDSVLEILSKYPFYKFNFETSWLVDNYLDCRSEDYRNRFFNFAEHGRASMNALYLNLMTGVCSGEELYRAMYFTQRLHREHGGNFDFACITDAPSHSWFLPTLFSDVGVKGFSNGANQTRAPILHYSDLNEDSPFYWEGMNGEKIFMWYARSYVQLKRLTGPDWGGNISNFDYLKSTVPQFLARYLRQDYTPDAVMIYGAYVDNAAIPANAEAPVIEQWNKQFEFPKLIVASDGDYFSYVEKNFANKLPVHRGDCGAYWEDGVGSTAKATTINRHTQQILPAAETAAALASIFEPKNRYPAEDFRRAWNNVMFYDEHTWGAYCSISQPDRQFVTRQWEIKESYSTHANLEARNLLARANNRLCQEIAVDGSSIIAFNWQNYPRTEVLEAEIDHSQQLVDLSNNKVAPMDVVLQRDGWKRVRFLAQDVPPFGYKSFAIRGYDSKAHMPTEKNAGETIENEFYRLTIDTKTGAINSLLDKTEHRELADTNAAYKLNEFLYVSGGDNSLLLNDRIGSAPAHLNIDTPTTAEVVENLKTPLGQRIVVVTKAKNTPRIRSEYSLYDNIKRVDIINTVDKEETRAKEAVYFAFPFATAKPALEYQIQNGWCRPNDDQLPGACREWFTPQNLMHVSDGDFSIAWATPDAPLVTLCDINRGKWLQHLPINNGHVYSYVMNNYWFTNYRAQQGGNFVFRYSISSGNNVSREELARFDADTRMPVIAYPFLSSFAAQISQAGRPMPAGAGSFIKLPTSNLQFVTLKEAEDGEGFILRLREVAGKNGEAEVEFPLLHVISAHQCNGVEVDQRKLSVTEHSIKFSVQPYSFVTLRFKADVAHKTLAKR